MGCEVTQEVYLISDKRHCIDQTGSGVSWQRGLETDTQNTASSDDAAFWPELSHNATVNQVTLTSCISALFKLPAEVGPSEATR